MHPHVPRISLGLPAYMAAKWIGSCLESALAQTVSEFELIISDNCSTDETYAIVQRFAERDSRIRAFRQAENVGITANHNFTYLQASAPYFCWLSATDIYHPEFLARCLKAIESAPDVVLAAPRASTFFETPGDGQLLAENRLPEVQDPRRQLFAVMSATLGTSLFRGVYRRSAIGNRIPLQPIFGNDLLLVVEMAATGRVVQIDEPLYYERVSAGARTAEVPLYMRAQYYEPAIGVSCILFHRMRVQMRYWGIPCAMRRAFGNRSARRVRCFA